ncbi:MAG: recombinase family protein [Rhizomicrobium sp.]
MPRVAAQEQLATIRAYAKVQQWRFSQTRVYVDIAGGRDWQPAKSALVNAACEKLPGFHFIVVSDFSRLSEDRWSADHIVRFIASNGIKVRSVADEMFLASEQFAQRVNRLYDRFLKHPISRSSDIAPEKMMLG